MERHRQSNKGVYAPKQDSTQAKKSEFYNSTHNFTNNFHSLKGWIQQTERTWTSVLIETNGKTM